MAEIGVGVIRLAGIWSWTQILTVMSFLFQIVNQHLSYSNSSCAEHEYVHPLIVQTGQLVSRHDGSTRGKVIGHKVITIRLTISEWNFMILVRTKKVVWPT